MKVIYNIWKNNLPITSNDSTTAVPNPMGIDLFKFYGFMTQYGLILGKTLTMLLSLQQKSICTLALGNRIDLEYSGPCNERPSLLQLLGSLLRG